MIHIYREEIKSRDCVSLRFIYHIIVKYSDNKQFICICEFPWKTISIEWLIQNLYQENSNAYEWGCNKYNQKYTFKTCSER